MLGKVAIVIALAAALGSLGVTPAFGDDRGKGGYYDNDNGYRAVPAKHKKQKRPPAHHSAYYAPPPVYYATAPVYYAPQPTPGISLFIPIRIR
jgi:hypothetical protein